MELNKYELEMILQAVRNGRNHVARDFEEAIKSIDKKLKDGECLMYGVAETLEVLQRYTNLILKLEDELMERNK